MLKKRMSKSFVVFILCMSLLCNLFGFMSFAESTLPDGTADNPVLDVFTTDKYKNNFGAVFETPVEYTFQVGGRRFILLKNVNANEHDGYFVIADYTNDIVNHSIGSGTPFYNLQNVQCQKYDPTDPLSIAYVMNQQDFINQYIPAVMIDYLNIHKWWVEAGQEITEPYYVESKLALLSYTEYQKNAERIGLRVGWNWWLRTPVRNDNGNNSYNRVMLMSGNKDTTNINFQWSTNTYSTWPAIRPCFYLSEDFFKEVKLDLYETGSEVKAVICRDLTIEEARQVGYSEFELRQLGYYGEFNIELDAGVTIREDGTYMEHPYKDFSVFYTPAEYKFQVIGSNKTYILLNNVNATEEDGQFVISDYTDQVSYKYYNSENGSQKFDPNDELSIAHFINSSAYMNAHIPSAMLDYINEHTWWIERGYKDGTNYEDPYSVRCKIALLSTTEYGKNADRIGTVVGRHWWLRTPVSSKPNYIATIVGVDTEAWHKNVYRQYESTSSWPYIRPCFYLNKNFFKQVKLDVATMGSEVKKYLLENVTIEEARAAGYSEFELVQLGYLEEIDIELDDGVTIPEGEEFAAHPYKESAVFYTPAEYKFQVSGSDKVYVLLNNVNATEEDGQFVIADYANILNKKYYNSDTGSQRFDPTDPLSIAYYINSPDYMNVYIPSEMLDYINEHTWWIERGYKDGTNYEDPYSVSCKIALLSTTEYGKNVDRIGTVVGRHWWLRTPVSNQPNRIAALVSSTNNDWQRKVYTHYASTSTWPAIRPCFYLDKEFFKEVKLDVATMGSEVKKYLLENVSREEAGRLYTQIEMESIGYNVISFTNVRTALEDNMYKVMVDVSITGADASSEPLVLIAAVYSSDDILVKTALTDTDIIANGEVQPVEVNVDVTGLAGYRIKVFAWRDLESLYPYTDTLLDDSINLVQ